MGGIGDILMMTPIIKAVKEKYPNSKLFVAVKRKGVRKDSYYLVLKNLKYVDKIIESKYINKKDFDLFYDLTKCCTLYERPGLTFNRIDLFASACEVSLEDKTPIYDIEIGEKLSKDTIAIHIKSEDEKRNWPEKYNYSLINLILRNTKYNVLILDNNLEETVNNPRVSYCTNKNIEETAALLKQCKYFVGPDSCFMHFAAAFKIPSLVLMGSIPIEARLKHYSLAKGITSSSDCLECWYEKCNENIKCMILLDPGTVFKELKGLINEKAQVLL